MDNELKAIIKQEKLNVNYDMKFPHNIQVKEEPECFEENIYTNKPECQDYKTLHYEDIKVEGCSDIYIYRHELFSDSAIKMEVVADDNQQQHTQQQSKRNIQSQTRPFSNAERQRRYREKKKADKMNACTTFSQCNDIQPEQEQPQIGVQVNKRQPQSSAERQRKYRKYRKLREQQQQQQKMEDSNSIGQLQNVDEAELARKRHLNQQRQSRFRARRKDEERNIFISYEKN